MSVLIATTLVAVLCSLWIRRHTWRSRWEAGASLNIALQGCAVLLMSPWASATLGPLLHRAVGLWNVEDLIGHLCLMVAVTAIIDHGLARLADEHQVRGFLRKHVAVPLQLGGLLLVAVFVVADEGYHPDLFRAHIGNLWLGAYWLVLGGLLIYLFAYAGRVFLILRLDPRSTATVYMYLLSTAFGIAAHAIQMGTAWAGLDVSLPIWLCACLGATGFAYGSARSWRAKVAWFMPDENPPSQPAAP